MSNSKVIRAAGAMGAATFMSRILGLVREQVFAYMFGAGSATDAFQIAFRIPNLLRDLFAEGAMSAALVPTFTEVREKEGDLRAWRVAGLVFRVLFGVVLVISIFGIIFAPQLVSLYATAFREIPGKFELTVYMTRIMFPFFPLVALAAAFMAILNACEKFFIPAFSSALFNLASIVTGVIFSIYLQGIEGMAIGVVIGGAVQAFCQLPLVYKQGYRYVPKNPNEPAWHRDPALRKMMALMIPGMIGLAATQINILVNSVLATSQGPGAVSWLGYAFRLMQFPIGIFGVSLASATLPVVSQAWVRKDYQGVAQTLNQSLKTVFAVNVAASMGLAFLGIPIIQLLFEYGRFQSSDTVSTANALAAYAVGLTAYSAVKVLVPVCYAMGRTRVAVTSSVLAVGLTIVLNLLMVKPFGFVGLALGTSIAAIVNSAFLYISIRNELSAHGVSLSLRDIILSFFKNVALGLLMGVVSYYSYKGLSTALVAYQPTFKPVLVLFRLGMLSLIIFEAVLVLLFFAKLFGVKEFSDGVEIFSNRLRKKLKLQ